MFSNEKVVDYAVAPTCADAAGSVESGDYMADNNTINNDKKFISDDSGISGSSSHHTVVVRSSNPALRLLNNIMPAGGMLATMFSLASTCIGAGVVGLPNAFSTVGIIMGAFYVFAVAAETAYSIRLLAMVSEKTGLKTYEEMMSGLVHPKGLYFVGIVRLVFCFGCCVAYVVTIGDLLDPVLSSIKGSPSFLLSYWGIRILQLALWLCFFFPLMLPRQVNSLRYVSTVGVMFILFFCICIIIHACTSGLRASPRPATKLVNTGNTAINGLGVFIFSFTCQINCVEMFHEMTHKTVPRFTLAASVSMAFCGTLSFLTGLFGYLDFGDVVKPSVLRMFDPIEEVQFLVSYIGVFVKICASYALLGGAARSAFCELVSWDSTTIPLWKHLSLAVSISVLSLICGLFIPNINMVFNFVGGICGGFLAFILPALYYMYSGNWHLSTVGIVNYVCTYLMLMAGCVAVVFGTASTIYSNV